MYCLSRERVPKTIAIPAGGVGEVSYALSVWAHPDTGKRYHIALSSDYPVTDEQIAFAVVLSNFTPAWDLNA
jgi:hypothetical protein